MDAIVQYLISRSKLAVSLVSITNSTEDSCFMTIQCRLSGTGPISSLISPMQLSMTFEGSCFAKLELPEVKTSFRGADITIEDQLVKILDLPTFRAFVHSVTVNDKTSFLLEDGQCTIKALGVTACCDYCMEIPIAGMMGPRAKLKNLVRNEEDGDNITMTVEVQNPSPVEINHGNSMFQLRNDKGAVVAELQGDLAIVRGSFDVVLEGTLNKGVELGEEFVLAGIGVKGKTWCDETIQYIGMALKLTAEHAAMLRN